MYSQGCRVADGNGIEDKAVVKVPSSSLKVALWTDKVQAAQAAQRPRWPYQMRPTLLQEIPCKNWMEVNRREKSSTHCQVKERQ